MGVETAADGDREKGYLSRIKTPEEIGVSGGEWKTGGDNGAMVATMTCL